MSTVDADEGTEADSHDPTEELGTHAQSPYAIAAAAVAKSSTGPKSSTAGLVAKTQPPTAAQALDHADLSRMRVFHLFGITAPLAAGLLALAIGGDRLAQILFWVGVSVLSAANVGLVWLAAKPERWQPKPVGVLWIVATIGVLPMLYYFGPFSAVVMVPILGIIFISLGRSRWISTSIVTICVVAHLALALPMIFGWIPDVGVLSSEGVALHKKIFAEVLIIAFQFSGFALGRWARSANTTAVAELQSAMRIIGDQQQVLAEAKDDDARVRHADEGRWSGQQMGGWKIGHVLGRGAMGDVYEAAGLDGRSIAIKMLNTRTTASPSLVERFHREMDVAARLVSPHIVRVLEISPPDAPVPYLAMERLYGTDLATRLRSEPRIPSDELGVMLDQVSRGLETARVSGVVHRDLKPHNLFFHEGSTWKILDFGVAKIVGGEGTLTGEGVVGTPQYMAPEQASGGLVTHLADVYALGAIAYRCLTGRSPFKGKDLAELVYQVVHAPPIRPGVFVKMSPSVEDVLAVAMAKDPRQRFPSAVSFAQAFIVARRGKPIAVDVPDNAWC
ncbi:MAG: serine/threonine-protein kinase [Kofleriaceae bacterium]